MKTRAPILKFASCKFPEESGQQEQYFQAFRRQGPDGSRPAGQGFMSTQRRENRITPATKWAPFGHRRGLRCRWLSIDRMEREKSIGVSDSAPLAQKAHADASGGTAPPGFFRFWLATNSLQSDYRNTQLVRLVAFDIRRGFAAPGAGHRAAAVTLKSFGSSFPHIPSPSGSRASPSILAACTGSLELPDGKVRWQKRFVSPARRMRRGLQF